MLSQVKTVAHTFCPYGAFLRHGIIGERVNFVSMIIRNVFLFVVGVVFSEATFAQEQPEANKEVITYDPVFWREELRLDAIQYNKIQEINSDFYKQLKEVSAERSDSRQAVQAKLTESLQQRSQQIWQTLYPRQRKKLERILREI